jgi:hypothetical protein
LLDNTQEWNEYQIGLDYNNKISLYATTELNWNMYNGKQWIGVATNGLPKWTFNICKSSINYFIAFICSQKVKLAYSAENIPDEPTDPQDMQVKEFVSLLSNMADMKWEKDKMDSKLRNLMLDGANTGDFAAYVYWDPKKKTGQLEKGDFCTEVVDGINVMFGNPNNREVEPQPYILILGREMVSVLKKEAKENKISQDLIDSITSDSDTQYQSGANGKVELDNKGDSGKCNYIIKFWKKNDTVFWNKSTRYCPIRKDIDLGISRYPIAWGNWDTIKNSYHGMAAIEGIIDNQISINQLFAMVSYWMKMAAFGKVIYDKSRITSWSNKLGEAIGADGDIRDIVQQLQAGNFNAAVLKVIDMAIQYTKEFIGANDNLTGQVNPEQASGTAIISAHKQASMPLGNISANRDQFVEDLGLIWGEFFLKKYKNRKVSYRQNEKIVTGQYSSEGMNDILLSCKVDVGPSSYFSEIQGIQELARLLKDKEINKLQYFERMAKMNIIPDCQGLIKDAQAEMDAIRKQAEMQQQAVQGQDMQMQQQQAQEQSAKEAQYAKMMEFFKALPKEAQDKLLQLPNEQMESMVLKMMQEDVKNTVQTQ